ncbi:MAG TPA: hypothetical protein VH500_04695 [Nitrososphaeraceae archaeon]
MIGTLNLYPGLKLQNPNIQGQIDENMKTNDKANRFVSNSSANVSQVISKDIGNHFTISCKDFKQLFDALVALKIGNEAAEGKINQSTFDGVENIFNKYAGNCSQLDEFEVD